MHLDFMLTYVEFMFDLCLIYVGFMLVLCWSDVDQLYCWTKKNCNPCWKCKETKLNGLWNVNWLLFFFSFSSLSCLFLHFSIFFLTLTRRPWTKGVRENTCFRMFIPCWFYVESCWFYVVFKLILCCFYVDLYILSEGFLCVFRSAGHPGYGGYVDLYWFYIDFILISCWLMYPTKVLRHRSLICWFILIFFCFLVDSMIVVDFVLIYICLFDFMLI